MSVLLLLISALVLIYLGIGGPQPLPSCLLRPLWACSRMNGI